MPTTENQLSLILIVRWVLATVVGLSAGLTLEFFLLGETAYPTGCGLGIILCSVQSLSLKRVFSLPVQLLWIIAGGLSFPLAWQVQSVLLHDQLGLILSFRYSSRPILALVVVSTSAGLVISSIQAIVLSFFGVKPTNWIAASVAGLCFLIGLSDIFAVPEYAIFSALSFLIGFVLGATIYGCLTGYVLHSQLVIPTERLNGDGE